MSFNESKLAAWSLRVRRAANFTCDVCGYHHVWWRKKRRMHAHHLFDKSTHPKLAYKDSNGRCACELCHIEKFHNDHMGGTHVPCTPSDWSKFKGEDSLFLLAFIIVLCGLIVLVALAKSHP